MLQVRTCVSVHCDLCGDALGSPEFEAHFRTERAALRAAMAERWRTGWGRRLVCSPCAPVLTCEVEGHEFSVWRRPVLAGGLVAVSEYRYCWRCCSLQSRPVSRDRRDGGESR